MCLYKTHDEPKVAQSNIEVWKVLTPKGLSPFQGYQYHPGMNKPSVLKIKQVPVEQQEIDSGYLHAFRNKEKAEGYTKLQLYKNAQYYIYEEYVVQRMLIPAGTIYYVGANDDICAERLYWPEEGTAHPNPVKIKEV